jgi:hypothetical protein
VGAVLLLLLRLLLRLLRAHAAEPGNCWRAGAGLSAGYCSRAPSVEMDASRQARALRCDGRRAEIVAVELGLALAGF